MNYFIKTPRLLHSLYRDAVWFLPNPDNKIYLTFDDGPVTGITSKCLDILLEHQVKATFFCVGQNIEKSQELYNRIRKEGHKIGNHSYNHLNGWKTDNKSYFDNIDKGAALTNSLLFRPPYGKIKRSQLKKLHTKYKIIMWDVLSADFDPKVTEEECIQNVLKHTTSGSIIVMHDNEKCGNKMLNCLPTILKELKAQGYQFEVLPA
ncbi:MAG: polysaccharide deacetylase family protein [Flavobacteriales bacterium]|nr:polysaccharide deacetylase family protein [Flavobacteriales bacterium]